MPHAASAQQAPRTGAQAAEIAAPQKILSIGGDITEILYAIGAGDRIAAVDTTSQFPPEALQTKMNVGYMRALSTEGVLSIGGDLIIASSGSGPPEVVKALKSAPVRYIEIADDFSPKSIADKTREVARAAGLSVKGEVLAMRIEGEFETLAGLRKQIAKPVRALFILNVVNGRVMVGGSGSSADAILKLAGAENAAASVQGYKPVSDEALVDLRPDAIITMRRTASGTHSAGQVSELRGLTTSPAVKDQRIVEMDGLYLIGFGPRAPSAALELMRWLYPDVPAVQGSHKL